MNSVLFLLASLGNYSFCSAAPVDESPLAVPTGPAPPNVTSPGGPVIITETLVATQTITYPSTVTRESVSGISAIETTPDCPDTQQLYGSGYVDGAHWAYGIGYNDAAHGRAFAPPYFVSQVPVATTTPTITPTPVPVISASPIEYTTISYWIPYAPSPYGPYYPPYGNNLEHHNEEPEPTATAAK